MNYKNLFGADFSFNQKTIFVFGLLLVFPNFLGLINFSYFGYKLHFFQILIFLASFLYGPIGGALSGAAGSVYTAFIMNNPYILVGNIILGFFVGYFFSKGFNPIYSVIFAYLIQIPWLWVTDIYLVGMTTIAVQKVIISLFVSNIVWAFVGWKLKDQIKTRLVD